MPDGFAGREASRGEAAGHIYSVSELTYLIKGKLEAEFPRVWVEGEISGFREAQSGHLYFTLKDESSQLKAIMFRSRLREVRFRPEDGLKVLALGQVTVYVPRGDYQMVVETLEPRGLGALQAAFEQLKARLRAEGLFDEARKRPIPAMPSAVGVVTSPTGAAVRDIINVMKRRHAAVQIVLAPARVQGEGAAAEIARGIADLNRWGKVDVIIVGRGGGSLEDLWAFNEEEVARAIHASAIPVISAVGHEIDFTISDFAADLRAPTPSAAAELVVGNRLNLLREVDSLAARLRTNVRERLSGARRRLESAAGRRVLARPEDLLAAPRQRLDEAVQGLGRVVGRSLAERKLVLERARGRLGACDPRARLAGWRRELPGLARRLSLAMANGLSARTGLVEAGSARLQALSPLAVLARGYSICRALPGGEVVTSHGQVRAGDGLRVILHRGELDCRVTATEPGHGWESDAAVEGT